MTTVNAALMPTGLIPAATKEGNVMDDARLASGQRLHRYVLERMARKGISSVSEIARVTGVGRDTMQSWWRGTKPTPRAGDPVAHALGVSYGDLIDAYEGRKRPTLPVFDEAALDELVDRLWPKFLERMRSEEAGESRMMEKVVSLVDRLEAAGLDTRDDSTPPEEAP